MYFFRAIQQFKKKKVIKTAKVCKSYHFDCFLHFSQFLLDIKMSQIQDFVYNVDFVTLAKTNSPQSW